MVCGEDGPAGPRDVLGPHDPHSKGGSENGSHGKPAETPPDEPFLMVERVHHHRPSRPNPKDATQRFDPIGARGRAPSLFPNRRYLLPCCRAWQIRGGVPAGGLSHSETGPPLPGSHRARNGAGSPASDRAWLAASLIPECADPKRDGNLCTVQGPDASCSACTSIALGWVSPPLN